MQKSWPMWLGLGAGIAALAAGFLLASEQIEQWRLATRYTARVGFPLLILAYVARPLTQVWRGGLSKALLQKRKYFGLGFAFSHTIHLVALVTFFAVSGEPVDWIAVVGGGWGYLLLFAMAITSNRAAMKALGVWWKRLHWVGIHTLWTIFLVSYSGRIFEADFWLTGLIGTAILLGSGVIRMMAWIKTRQARSARSA